MGNVSTLGLPVLLLWEGEMWEMHCVPTPALLGQPGGVPASSWHCWNNP